MRRTCLAALAVLVTGASGACDTAASNDGGPDAPTAPTGPVMPDVVAVTVKSASGAAPVKGEPLQVEIEVANTGGAGTVRLTPRISSQRFTGFTDVALGTVELELAAGAGGRAMIAAGPFLEQDGARFAIGRGDYVVGGVTVAVGQGAPVDDTRFGDAEFAVAESGALLQAVVYDAAYFTAIHWTDTPEAYLTSASTRASELFTPSAPGSSSGSYQALPGGLDQLMGVEQHFLALPGLAASEAAGGFCEQIAAYGHGALGLSRDWDVDEGQASWTDVDHHGFDMLIGLTPAMGGGAACGWLGVQVSGLFTFDLSLERSQIILVHETGHLLGAPHCDPLQGYVMCAGEVHAHYQANKTYVWHQVSRDTMANHWR